MKITTADEMRQIDKVTSEKFGVHSLGLMESAGTAVASFAREQWPRADRITVVCGKGNNGGDGFVAARRLHQMGKIVEVVLLGDPSELKGDAANMYGRLPVRPVVIRTERDLEAELSRSIANAALIIDAILGTGFKPPVAGLAAAAIQGINAATAPVLSLDIPSGASADSYTADPGPYCRSDAIITFTAPRPAHLFGQLTRGPLAVAPIGSPDAAIVSALNMEVITSADIAPLLAPRALDANKGRFGHVLIIGGSLGKAGAAAMAGIGALRSGAGLVTVATPRSVLNTVAGFAAELMTEPLAETHQGTISLDAFEGEHFTRISAGKNVIAIGPGLSRHPESAQLARAVLKRSKLPMIIDADGLNAFESAPAELTGAGRTLIITPHPGEMSRLAGKPIADIQANRLAIARSFARDHQCIVVLKGYRTIVALPTGLAYVNPSGNAGMATGGTGDVLTGLIAGFVAQFADRPEQAVCAAVFLHGLAGDYARDMVGEQPMVATDLLRYTPDAVRRARQWASERILRINSLLDSELEGSDSRNKRSPYSLVASRHSQVVMTREYKSNSAEETIALGRQLAPDLRDLRIVLLRGDLGAGKTTLTKGIAEAFQAAERDEVTSPTFTLVHEYRGPERSLYHIDLYRIDTDRELATLGLDDLLLEPGNILLIEWGEKFPRFVRERDAEIVIRRASDTERKIQFTTVK